MRRRGSGGPFQRPRVPGIIASYFPPKKRNDDVPKENQRGYAHEENGKRREHIHPSPMRQIRVSEDTPRHPQETEKMLNDKRHVEADDHQPESPFAEPLREHPSAHFRKPKLHGSQEREEDRAHGDEVKMGDEIIAVLGLPIEGHDRVADPSYPGH